MVSSGLRKTENYVVVGQRMMAMVFAAITVIDFGQYCFFISKMTSFVIESRALIRYRFKIFWLLVFLHRIGIISQLLANLATSNKFIPFEIIFSSG